MTPRHCLAVLTLTLPLTLSGLGVLVSAHAQPASTGPSASAPPGPRAKPPVRRLTPDELRDSASTPGDLRPEDPVVPQIRIPLGRPAAGPAPAPKPPARRDKSGTPGIDDDAARCRAQASSQARAACAKPGR
jgi:hypothetical protein